MSRALAVGALAAVLVVALAACGGGGKAASTTGGAAATTTAPLLTPSQSRALAAKGRYQLSMQKLGATLQAALTTAGQIELAAGNAKAAPAKDATALVHARSALRAAAGRLARIVAPRPVSAEQALLLRGVREYADELGAVIAQLRANGMPVTVLQEILKFKGVKDMQDASLQIAKKGYDIVG